MADQSTTRGFGPERGIFWRADVHVPDGQFAPDEHVHGVLTIDEGGRVELDLDGVLSCAEGEDPFFAALRENTDTQIIYGVLIRDTRSVILESATKNGSTGRLGGISTQSYLALRCLLAPRHVRPPRSEVLVRRITVPLAGFEEWLSLRSLRRHRSKDSISVEYEPRVSQTFEAPDALLTYETHLEQVHGFPRSTFDLQLRDVPELGIQPREPEPLSDSISRVSELEELMTLLTDAEQQLLWPTVEVFTGGEKEVWLLYYLRGVSKISPVERHRAWVPYDSIAGDFLHLVARWRALRLRIGAGAYSYLATRRGEKLYAEHHLISLIWGLESFSREQGVGRPSRTAINRLEKIKEQIGAERDRTWLEQKLRAVREPELESRLRAVLSQLPVTFSGDNLRDFAHRLAKARNELSHHGRLTKPDGGSAAGHAIKLAHALASLYHAVLLQALKVPDDIISRALLEGHTGTNVSFHLDQVGLKLVTATESSK